MKREGRQHGMLRPCSFPRGRSDDKVTVHFTKVSSKPTNQSKFTGKCSTPNCPNCHFHPVSKSKGKAKGAHKMRSASDVDSACRLITWRVVDLDTPASGLKFSGLSGTGILDYLEGEYNDYGSHVDTERGSEEIEVIYDGTADRDDDDDRMSFCEIGFVWNQVEGDESWCLVDEI